LGDNFLVELGTMISRRQRDFLALNRNQAHENIIVVPKKYIVGDFNELVKLFFDKRFIAK
jgi:hypothetical protein